MATRDVVLAPDAARRRDLHLSPLDKVQGFFDALSDLRQTTDSSSSNDKTRLLMVCEKVSLCGEQVVLCLENQIWQHNRAAETAQEVAGVFRLGLRKIVHLRRECEELKRYLKELQLAERNIDATSSGLPALQEKQKRQREFTVPGGSAIPHAVSFEDLRRHRDSHISSSKRSSVESFGNIRRTRSDTDVALQSLKKKVESLTIDNSKLRESEKKLIKEKIKLTRTCKMLEVERDRAEDRLKIEQAQRDSVERLRQRNKELEEQLRALCESQVLRERERAEKQQRQTESTPDPDTSNCHDNP